MRPFALIGFVAALQTAHGDPAGEAEGSSMLQVNTNKATGCNAAKHFCYEAINYAEDCVEQFNYTGTTEGVCERALCHIDSVDDPDEVRSEEASVMRAMCKRAARSRRWGPAGLTCPLPNASSGHVYKQFCDNLETQICDAWAFNFVRRAHEKSSKKNDELCGDQFVTHSKEYFKESNGGPGCSNYKYEDDEFRYLPGLPSVSEYMAQSSSFVWTWVDDNTRKCRDADKLDNHCRDKKCTKDTCLHKCERESDCHGVVFEPKKSDSNRGVCKLKKRACFANTKDASSWQLDRGAGLVQISNASDSKIPEEDEPLLAELTRRSLKVGSSEDVIDQHLESSVLKKCAEPCD